MPARGLPPARRSRRIDRLAEEVALLSRATRALHTGHAQDALDKLAEHQREFPRGLLTQQRRAARAQALYQLGRMAEAESELGRLSPSPGQAHKARIWPRALMGRHG